MSGYVLAIFVFGYLSVSISVQFSDDSPDFP